MKKKTLNGNKNAQLSHPLVDPIVIVSHLKCAAVIMQFLNQFVIFPPRVSCQSALDIKRFNDGFSLEVLFQSRAAAVLAHDDDVYVINLMRIIIIVVCCEHYGKGSRKLKLIVGTFFKI